MTQLLSVVTYLAAEVNSFIGIEPKTHFGSAPRPPEWPVLSHRKSNFTSVSRPKILGTKPRTATALTAKDASHLEVFDGGRVGLINKKEKVPFYFQRAETCSASWPRDCEG